MGLAEKTLRVGGVAVRNTIATNAVDPCLFAAAEWMVPDPACEEEELVAVVSTSQLVYNSRPTKLGAGCIVAAAKKLAKMELECEAISERVASSNYMLTAIRRSVSAA